MAKSTTNYEVVIGTGNNDSDSAVEVRLINAKGECSAYKKPAEYGPPGRDNYEKGSIEICTGIPYELAGDPVKVDIKFAGKKWYLGGIWVTNQTTGNAWYFRDGKLITERYTTIDLTSVSKESDKKQSDQQHSDKLYDKFSCRIITGSDGTDNKVFLKLFDGQDRATYAFRPTKDNPPDDFKPNDGYTYDISAAPVPLGDIEYILLAKYGKDSWIPSEVIVQGKGPIGINGVKRSFTNLHPLTKKDNKWIFVPRDVPRDDRKPSM